MKKLISFSLSLMLFAGLISGAGSGLAQGSEPEAPLAPLGVEFTYQGQLKDSSGAPMTAVCDFRFSLWDDGIAGSQVGTTDEVTGVSVIGGYFTALVNAGNEFGTSAFNGSARWLQVAVKCTGDADFSSLTPRQPLNAAPYAAYSRLAPWSGLSGVPAGFADGVDDNTLYLAGTGLILNGTTFNADTSYLQRRVGSVCAAGSSMRVINPDGTVTCEVDDDSSNAHNHLGQTWTGSNNPLVIDGAFDWPNAPLMLSNSGSAGLRIESAATGVWVESTDFSGLYVNEAGGDGVIVLKAGSNTWSGSTSKKNGVEVGGAENNGLCVYHASEDGTYIIYADDDGVYVKNAGSPSTDPEDPNHNGFEVAGAEGYGLYVGRADLSGVKVNSAVVGVNVNSAETHGLYVDNALIDGIRVRQASDNGVSVYTAGNPSAHQSSDLHDGFEISGAQGHGLAVGRSDQDGVYIYSAGDEGVYVREAGGYGMFVDSSVEDAFWGETTSAVHEWGLYTPDKIYAMNVTAQAFVMLARVAGPEALQPGDLAAAAGIGDPLPEGGEPLALVGLANPAALPGVVGVVQSRLAFTAQAAPDDVQPHPAELHSADGPAQPGDYVAVMVYGVARVKVDASSGEIAPGMRLTAAELPGTARPLRTVTLEGIALAESAPVLGIVLNAPDAQGYVWVLVNPQ